MSEEQQQVAPVTPIRPDRQFDPSQHFSKIKGQDYLEVKWRLVWFRSEYPAGSVETRLIAHEHDRAIVEARVEARTEHGELRGVATGIGSETASGFGNYIEKSETKAIGRALAALGFGTQFADDFADAADGTIADAPVQRGPSPAPRQQQARRNFRQQGQQQGGDAMSSAQRGKLNTLVRAQGLTPSQMDALCHRIAGTDFNGLTKRGASAVIDHLVSGES